MQGRVFKSTGSWYNVVAEDNQLYQCRLRGKFKLEGVKVTNPIAVGDWVELEIEDKANNTGLITDILPRTNYIIRKSTRKTAHGHIIAANLDQAVLVATLVFPRTSLGFIDRYLVTAESFRIPSLLVFNKTDLLEEEGVDYQEELCELYQQIGYDTISISAFRDEDIERLKKKLESKASLFSGHSGVGKSTILNRLHPDIRQKTAEVSTFAEKGVHTTTFAEMFQIADETFVIDTPGIKEMGLMDIHEGELSHFFPEMRALMGQCKFYNCSHTHEPKCAVIEAVQSGKIAESRYYNYLSMLENEDNRR